MVAESDKWYLSDKVMTLHLQYMLATRIGSDTPWLWTPYSRFHGANFFLRKLTRVETVKTILQYVHKQRSQYCVHKSATCPCLEPFDSVILQGYDWYIRAILITVVDFPTVKRIQINLINTGLHSWGSVGPHLLVCF